MKIYYDFDLCHFSFTCFRMLWFQPTSPIRSEVDVKLGGTRCNFVMGRLKPWMQLWTSKKKKMVLREETPISERSQSTKSKDIMWTCTISAPEMTIVLYNLNGLAVYHVSCLPKYLHIFDVTVDVSFIKSCVLHCLQFRHLILPFRILRLFKLLYLRVDT